MSANLHRWTPVLLTLAMLTAANGASALVLTAPPPSAFLEDVHHVCSSPTAYVTVNGKTTLVSAVCAYARAAVNFDCANDGPGYVKCIMKLTLWSGGDSPAFLPGNYTWPAVGINAGIVVCDGNEQGSGQTCIGADAAFFGSGQWPGLIGSAQASDGFVWSPSIRMPLDFNIQSPHCYSIQAGGLVYTVAKVVDGVGATVASAQASAGITMKKSFCN